MTPRNIINAIILQLRIRVQTMPRKNPPPCPQQSPRPATVRHTRRFNVKPILWIILAAVAAAACGPAPQTTTAPALPTGTATLRPTPRPTFTPQPTFTPFPTQAPPQTTNYKLVVKLDYAARFVSVGQTIQYPNKTGQTLNTLVMSVTPNLWRNAFTLTGLQVNGIIVENYNLRRHRLEVPLDPPLAPGAVAKIDMAYTLQVPEIPPAKPSVEKPSIFGYTSRQLNLVDWYPFIVPYDAAAGWLLYDPTSYGEYLVYDTADYEIILSFETGLRAESGAGSQGPSQPIPVVAASGQEQPGPLGSKRFILNGGRTFALSASTDYQVSTQDAGGVTVLSYYFPLYPGPGQAAAQAAAAAIQMYSQKFGPYPHKTLSIVQGDFSDSMEYSALFFHSKNFYDLHDGTDKSYLVFVAAHETAHQWWFERVGSDQFREPWLDEALATYSERLYYEATNPPVITEIWSYARIDQYKPEGFIDYPVTGFPGYVAYETGAYKRGAMFLHALRERIGDEAFFAFLAEYASEMDGKRATSADFFRILRNNTRVNFSDITSQYFQTQP